MEAENDRLEALAVEGDRLIELVGLPGPLTLLRGCPDRAELELAAAITARYSKARDCEEAGVCVRDASGNRSETLTVKPARDEQIDRLRIG